MNPNCIIINSQVVFHSVLNLSLSLLIYVEQKECGASKPIDMKGREGEVELQSNHSIVWL